MDTLKAYKHSATLRYISLATIPVAKAMTARSSFLPKQSMAVPECEAVTFYLGNHMMAALSRHYDPAEPMAPEHADIARRHHEFMYEASLRMYFYLLQICCRESRHASNYDGVFKNYPSHLKSWYLTYRGKDQSHAIKALLKNSPDTDMGTLTQLFCDLFYKCTYGGGYGGPAWGKIADVLREYVHGTITAEMMVDTAWTLCHNNGPIFNKGMLYEQYSGDRLVQLLDLQRAGMIPRFVAATESGSTAKDQCVYHLSPYVSKQNRADVEVMAKISPDFIGEVDWQTVVNLGAVGDYSSAIHTQKMQKKAAGPASKTGTVEEYMQKVKDAKILAAKKAEEALQWPILPNLIAKKWSPVRAGAA